MPWPGVEPEPMASEAKVLTLSHLFSATNNSLLPLIPTVNFLYTGSRAYTMITIIIVAYIVNWAPYFIVQMIRLTSMSMCLSPTVRLAILISAQFGMLNAGINFVVYALVNRDFRYRQSLRTTCKAPAESCLRLKTR